MEDNLTYEDKANLDKLNFFYEEKIKVHLILKRTDHNNKNIFLNGLITEKLSDTLFLLQERVLGETRVSIFEVKDQGVEEFTFRGGDWK